MHILIADDSPVSLAFMEKVLESWGHEVTACRDGSEAWENLQKPDAPKLAVLDWEMPGMDGLDVCKRVREAGKDTYLIFLTARDDANDISEGMQAGVDDYICKPFRQEELEFRLRAGVRILELRAQLGK